MDYIPDTSGWAVRPLAIAILVFAAYVFVLPVSVLPGVQAAILWSTGHEDGTLSDWSRGGGGGEFNSGGGDTTVTTAIKRSGNYAAKLVSSPGSGSSGTRLFRWSESRANKALYYSAWFYFPSKYTTSWNDIFQWKSRSASNVSTCMYFLNIENRPVTGNMYLTIHRCTESPQGFAKWANQINQVDLPVGRWVHLEAYYSASPTGEGVLTAWQDGVKIYDLQGIRTSIGSSMYTNNVEWSVNNYTASISPNPATHYVDDAAISTQRLGPGTGTQLTSTPTSPPNATPTRTPTPSPTTLPPACPLKPQGDADCNGRIDLADFEQWRKEFTGMSATETADFNRDTLVNLIDFEIWRKSFL